MNTRLLRRIVRHVLADPRRLNMQQRAYHPTVTDRLVVVRNYGPEWIKPRGSRVGKFDDAADAFRRANAKALGLTHAQALRLFYVAGWPDKFTILYASADSNRAAALVLRRRVDHFIESDGQE